MMKGAIQVSIGFLIVMVISALVMIFMIGWLQPLFSDLTQISKYATDSAKDQMMDEFARGSDAVLATIPSQETFSPSSLVPFKMGVRKTGEYDAMDVFSICIGKLTSSSCFTAGTQSVKVTNKDGSTTTTLVDYVQPDDNVDIKFYMPKSVGIKQRNDIALSDARMDVGIVDEGLYGYRIYVCAEPGEWGVDSPYKEMKADGLTAETDSDKWTCNGLGESYGQYSFIVEVK